MYNEKGQAFSVFNLLIAAVVSLAILGLLMSIMGGIGGIGGGTAPDKAAKNLIEDAFNSDFQEQYDDVTFTDKIKIRAVALEASSSILAEEVGFCISDELPEGLFEANDSYLEYTKDTKYDAKLMAYCGNSDGLSLDGVGEDLISSCDLGENVRCVIGVFRK